MRKSLRIDEIPKYPEKPQISSLMKEIQKQGYQWKLTILKDFLRMFRKKEEKPIQRYETEPGEKMQVDSIVLRRGTNPLSAF